MEDPLISIIIPTYNSESNIATCLNSIIGQCVSKIEIVVIDGYSSDSTIEIVKNYIRKNSMVKWISEPDEGIYDAMNKGIRMAKGSWFYFLGSDDKLASPDVLRKVIDAIQDSHCDFLYGDVRMIGNSPWAKNGYIYDGLFTIEKLFTKNICHQAIFYKKTIFDRIGFYNNEYVVCADWDFNHRCFANTKTRYVNLVVADFFAGGQSTNTTTDKFTNEDFVSNLKRYYKISYFNKFFKNSSWIFANMVDKALREKYAFKSIYFLFFAWFHSKKKISLLKNYINLICRSK